MSLEQLKAKLPNLTGVFFANVSNEYMTKFCSDFSRLNVVYLDMLDIAGSHNLSIAISSLQNLRILDLWTSLFTEDQVYMILKNLTYLEEFYLLRDNLSHQSFLCLARMPRLRTLRINPKSGKRNIHLFTNQNNFPELRYLELDCHFESNKDNFNYDSWHEVQIQLENYRPALDVEIRL